jgi:hypothetical protein
MVADGTPLDRDSAPPQFCGVSSDIPLAAVTPPFVLNAFHSRSMSLRRK